MKKLFFIALSIASIFPTIAISDPEYHGGYDAWRFYLGGGFYTSADFSFESSIAGNTFENYVNSTVDEQGNHVFGPTSSNIALTFGFLYEYSSGLIVGGQLTLASFENYSDYYYSNTVPSIKIDYEIDRSLDSFSFIIGFSEYDFRYYLIYSINTISIEESYSRTSRSTYYSIFNTYDITEVETLAENSIGRSFNSVGIGFAIPLAEEASYKIELHQNNTNDDDIYLSHSFQWEFY